MAQPVPSQWCGPVAYQENSMASCSHSRVCNSPRTCRSHYSSCWGMARSTHKCAPLVMEACYSRGAAHHVPDGRTCNARVVLVRCGDGDGAVALSACDDGTTTMGRKKKPWYRKKAYWNMGRKSNNKTKNRRLKKFGKLAITTDRESLH